MNKSQKVLTSLPLKMFFCLALAVGCTKKEEAATSGTVAPAQAKVLNLYAMSDYLPASVIEKFEKRFNAKINYNNFSNNEELLAKLQSGAKGYDVIIPSDYMVTALIENKLVEPLDQSKIPNLKNLGSDFKNLVYDPKGEYSVPYMWGTTGLVYNSKFVKNPTESVELLFKAEYANKIALLEDSREAIGIAMRKLGYSGNSTSKKELLEAEKVMKQLKSKVRLFTSDPKQHLYSEDIWIAQAYSGDAKITAKTKPELKYFVPKEGSTLWIDNMAVPVGASQKDLAFEFINFILEPTIAQEMAESLLFSTPNSAADSLIKDETLRASQIKKVKLSKVELLKDLGNDSEAWDDTWTKIKSN
ncbi:MAG: PotD/PotF family extracellular solute-binding protein [Bdellovibrionales bacterium]